MSVFTPDALEKEYWNVFAGPGLTWDRCRDIIGERFVEFVCILGKAELSIIGLPEDAVDLKRDEFDRVSQFARTVGIDTLIKMMRAYGGSDKYIPKLSSDPFRAKQVSLNSFLHDKEAVRIRALFGGEFVEFGKASTIYDFCVSYEMLTLKEGGFSQLDISKKYRMSIRTIARRLNKGTHSFSVNQRRRWRDVRQP